MHTDRHIHNGAHASMLSSLALPPPPHVSDARPSVRPWPKQSTAETRCNRDEAEHTLRCEMMQNKCREPAAPLAAKYPSDAVLPCITPGVHGQAFRVTCFCGVVRNLHIHCCCDPRILSFFGCDPRKRKQCAVAVFCTQLTATTNSTRATVCLVRGLVLCLALCYVVLYCVVLCCTVSRCGILCSSGYTDSAQHRKVWPVYSPDGLSRFETGSS